MAGQLYNVNVTNELLTKTTCCNVLRSVTGDANAVYASIVQAMKVPSITTLTQIPSFLARQLPIEVRPLTRSIWPNYTVPVAIPSNFSNRRLDSKRELISGYRNDLSINR